MFSIKAHRVGFVGLVLLVSSCGVLATEEELFLPTCSYGEALGADGQNGVVCKPMPAPMLKDCAEGEALKKEGIQVRCTKPEALQNDTAALVQNLDILLGRVRGMVPTPTTGSGRYVGVTSMSLYTGLISLGGVDDGLASAAKECSSAFGPRAHLCTAEDFYQSLVRGTLAGVTAEDQVVPRAWVYYSSWSGQTGQENPEHGFGDNCAMMTYPLGSRKWLGTTVEWGALSTGQKGIKLRMDLCSMRWPLACCR